MLTRDDILKVVDLPTCEVGVAEWGGSVLVRGLTGKERDEFEQSLIVMHGQEATLALSNARARLVYLGCVNPDGTRMFTKEDVGALGRKSGAALDRVSEVIRKLSGLNETDIKEITANFTLAPSVDSISS